MSAVDLRAAMGLRHVAETMRLVADDIGDGAIADGLRNYGEMILMRADQLDIPGIFLGKDDQDSEHEHGEEAD